VPVPSAALRTCRLLATLIVLASGALATSGCARFGNLGSGMQGVIASDAQRLAPGDLAGPGPLPVEATGLLAEGPWGKMEIALYRPAGVTGRVPGVVFLPGRVAPEDQYESYARALASRGVVVAVRGWYSPFFTDVELARDARSIADWLVGSGYADPARLGIAGHSMGGKDAIMAAAKDPRFRAVVAIDPDDNGRISVVKDIVGGLEAPLLLIGAEVGWKGSSVCAPKAHNYQRFFERAPSGTIELTLRDADHVQVMDEPDRLGMGICRAGGADSFDVRTRSRRATVQFFSEHLLGAEPFRVADAEIATVRVKSTNSANVARATTPATR
jgi:pimeloyl-ACP methyl ester carboxylesterase